MRATITENNIQNAICGYLEKRKHFFWRQNTVGVYDAKNKSFRRKPKYAMNGVADIVVITDGGYAVFLEVKKPKGVLSLDQKVFKRKCEDKGCEYYVVRSIDDVKNIGL